MKITFREVNGANVLMDRQKIAQQTPGKVNQKSLICQVLRLHQAGLSGNQISPLKYPSVWSSMNPFCRLGLFENGIQPKCSVNVL